MWSCGEHHVGHIPAVTHTDLVTNNQMSTRYIKRYGNDVKYCTCLVHGCTRVARWCVRMQVQPNETNGSGQPPESIAKETDTDSAADQDGAVAKGPGTVQSTGFPQRFTIVLLCFVAFMLCNMDRVNMSIAVLPMQQEFGWNSQTLGIVQSSFFWCVPCPTQFDVESTILTGRPMPCAPPDGSSH